MAGEGLANMEICKYGNETVLEDKDRITCLGGQSRGGQAVNNSGRYYNILPEGLSDLYGKLRQQEASC